VLVFLANRREVAEVRAGVGGRYQVRLRAGIYTVTVQPASKIGFGLRPSTVRIVANSDRRVDFSIDTGIR
jgi:hypothetical protein